MRRLALAFLLACSSSKNPTRPPPNYETHARPIEIAELTVLFDGHPIAKLHADGRTESVGDSKPGPDAVFSPGPTLHADGRIELTKAGYTARVEGDGEIFIVPPVSAGQVEQRFGLVTGEVLQTDDAGTSGVRVEGTKLVMFFDGKPTNELGVFDPPHLRRTALILTAAFFMDLAISSR